jgi:putative redox protein
MRIIAARASAELGAENYRVDLAMGDHRLLADEPAARGGKDAGPAPYDLLLASLAACTAMTLRMYAERKQWPLTGVSLDLRYMREGERSWIDRRIVLKGDLDEAQRLRFAEIAERTPVTLTLKSGIEIKTELRESA